MAELVIATAASVTYPGGVVAVRASDWIDAGSSTASSEVNALASTGMVVRETQQIVSPNPPFLDEDAYDLAEDTLVMDAADIGLEDDLDYDIWITCFMEGERDLTNNDLLNRCSNYRWNDIGLAGVHGTLDQTETDPFWESRTLANVPHFWPLQLEVWFVQAATDTLHFRFFTQDGTTAEWLIDQIVFVPQGGSATWPYDNFQYVFSDVGIPAPTGPEDGADGGDANGKFTFAVTYQEDSQPTNLDNYDYQRKSDGDDAEYDQVVEQLAEWTEEVAAHGYSFHCARLREELTFTEDTFDNRTTGPGAATLKDMGISPEGYGYLVIKTSAAGTAYVDGTQGVLSLPNGIATLGLAFGSDTVTFPSGDMERNQGSVLWGHGQWEWRTIMEWVSADAGLDVGFLRFFIVENNSQNHKIQLDLVALTWSYFSPFATLVDGPNDASGFLVQGQPFGFRFEAKRYVFRFRFWDATGAEPSTWDYEDFWIIDGTAYPYSDNEVTARGTSRRMEVEWDFSGQSFGGGPFAPTVFHVYNNQFLNNPYGDPEDGSVRMERPQGDVVDDIVIPWGCPYMVYWGLRDWTEVNTGDLDLDFATRWWNDPTAAEIQRMATYWQWFRITHPALIPMNWRSSDRSPHGQNRILTGG